jgi:integration host factor subunit alpha
VTTTECAPDYKEKTMALTKDKLTLQLQTQIGMTKPESRQLVERLFEIMKSSLADGEDLLITGFGKFQVRQKNSRRGRNPQTRENLILAARKVLVFKTSRVLRARLNGE